MSGDLITTSGLAATLDPFTASERYLVVAAFQRSTSRNFPLALAIARAADAYGQWQLGAVQLHVAGFAATAVGVSRALALLRHIRSWKGTLVLSRGTVLEDPLSTMGVLRCYSDSCECQDYRAHCHEVIDDPAFQRSRRFAGMTLRIDLEPQPRVTRKVVVDRYLFPCKRIRYSSIFQVDHPASPVDLIQAAGVREGCHICPRFDPSTFQRVGQEEYEVDD